MVSSSKSGVSAKELQRELGIGYQAAWLLSQKLRLAMVRPGRNQDKLSGDIEVDESYLGGPTPGGKRGRDAEGKLIIAIAVERKGFGKKSKRWKLGRTRIQVMPDTKAQPADGAGRLAAVAGDPRRAAQGTATHEVTRVARTRPDVAARCVGRALGPSALQPKSTCQVSCQEQPGATRHSGYSLKPRFSLATPIGAGCRARDPAPPPAGQSARRRSSGGGHLPLCLCRLLWPARRSSLRTPFVMRQGPVC
jgi:hypothetical protein